MGEVEHRLFMVSGSRCLANGSFCPKVATGQGTPTDPLAPDPTSQGKALTPILTNLQ